MNGMNFDNELQKKDVTKREKSKKNLSIHVFELDKKQLYAISFFTNKPIKNENCVTNERIVGFLFLKKWFLPN